MKHDRSFTRRKPQQDTGVKCQDLLALATFGDTGTVRCSLTSAFDPKLAITVGKLQQITPGFTNVTAGLRVSIDLLSSAPHGLKRHIWLLSDGSANRDVGALMPEVARARSHWINISTIGFGDPEEYDEALLRHIAAATHGGRFMTAHTAEKLGKVFRNTAAAPRRHFAKGRADVFLVDASGSMFFASMGGRKRMEVVQAALYGLIRHKQVHFS